LNIDQQTQFLKGTGFVKLYELFKEVNLPYRLNPSFKDNYYHVYNRGNNKEQIFFDEKNYFYFLSKIENACEDKIDLVAYCLMPNHYHLITYVKQDGFLELAMQKISTGYSRAINKASNRTGHLFQGRFKNKLIPNNEYLLHLSRYIHRNPLRAGLVNNLDEWKFSSYPMYIGKIKSSLIKPIIVSQFKLPGEYARFVSEFQEDQNYYLKDLLF
jgi:putative transposase